MGIRKTARPGSAEWKAAEKLAAAAAADNGTDDISEETRSTVIDYSETDKDGPDRR